MTLRVEMELLLECHWNFPFAVGNIHYLRRRQDVYSIPTETRCTASRRWFHVKGNAMNAIPTLLGLARRCQSERFGLGGALAKLSLDVRDVLQQAIDSACPENWPPSVILAPGSE